MANVPSTAPEVETIGVDQQARRLWLSASSAKSAHSGSSAMSCTTTDSPRCAAVPQDPELGPMGIPAARASTNGFGKLGAAAVRKTEAFSSTRQIEHRVPGDCCSITSTVASRTSSSGLPIVIISRSRFCSAKSDSACFCSVTSVATPITPVTRPSSSRTGLRRVWNQMLPVLDEIVDASPASALRMLSSTSGSLR